MVEDLALVGLQATLRALGDAPTRSVTELAQRIVVAEANAAAVMVAPPTSIPPAAVPASPLVGTMGPNGALGVPRTRLSRRAMIAARKHATR
jgi:hypothetical protein